MAAEHDFTVDEGTTFRRKIVWRIGGVPAVLTGYSGRLTTLARGATAPLVLEEGAGVTTNQAGAGEEGVGEITFVLTPEQTFATMIGRYVLELFTNETVEKYRVLEGKFKVDPRQVAP